MLPYTVCYTCSAGCINGLGKKVVDVTNFTSYLAGSVRARLRDEETELAFQSDLAALASTDMAVNTLKRILQASAPDPEPWEIGESLAECLLEEEHDIKWPWNMERDKRTPKASLPGADLIGFIKISDTIMFVLGEVKTSGDQSSPPNIMYGRSGMIHQLDRLANNLQIHFSLIKWLFVRCKNTEFWPLFQEATRNYLSSGGKKVALFGILMRDTIPNQFDLMSRATALSAVVQEPTNVGLYAWYLPHPINNWPSLVIEV
jgi:hypothetical protein